jgi:hypothetical protein
MSHATAYAQTTDVVSTLEWHALRALDAALCAAQLLALASALSEEGISGELSSKVHAQLCSVQRLLGSAGVSGGGGYMGGSR